MTDNINTDMEKVVKSLKANRFNRVEIVEDGSKAAKLVLDMIPQDAQVGIGGSTTIRQIGLLEQLRKRGTVIINDAESNEIAFDDLMRRTLRSDVLLASSNAVTLDGKLVNIDGMGNRVAGMVFGPKKVILIIGKNKVVRNIDEALNRIKNVIAPCHAAYYGTKTPCATKGYCTDCNSPARICRITTIIEKKPSATDISIILVNEDLGLGWNPDWTKERKEKIASVYRETRRKYPPASRRMILK